MAEMWQTAFGKDFGGMYQGDDKTGTVGTDAMFVMTPQDVANMPADRFATYANHKRRTRTEFESRPAETLSTTPGS